MALYYRLALIISLTVFLTLNIYVVFGEPDQPYGGVRLLEGYKFKRSQTIDSINGQIYREGGLSIEVESGISEGYAAKPKDKDIYLWYREQIINGNKVMIALTTSGSGTKWQPQSLRGSTPGKILMITFPGKFGPNDAANFYGEILDEQEIVDMLLMALTFDPSK